MAEENGSVGGLRFLNPENVEMRDSDGNVVLCKCGKPAGHAAIGKHAFAAWGDKCALATGEAAKFAYRTSTNLTPTEEQIKKLESIGQDQWEIDLTNW